MCKFSFFIHILSFWCNKSSQATVLYWVIRDREIFLIYTGLFRRNAAGFFMGNVNKKFLHEGWPVWAEAKSPPMMIVCVFRLYSTVRKSPSETHLVLFVGLSLFGCCCCCLYSAITKTKTQYFFVCLFYVYFCFSFYFMGATKKNKKTKQHSHKIIVCWFCFTAL